METNWKKILLRTGAIVGLAGAAFGGKYFYGLYKLSKELQVDKKGMIHKVTLSGIIMRVIATIRNPTNATASLTETRVEILYKGKTLARSKKMEDQFDIPKGDAKAMPAIDIELDFMSLLMSVPDLVKEYRSTGKVTLTVDTRAKIDGWYDYKDIQDVPVGGKEGQRESVSGILSGWFLNDLRNNWG